MQKLCSMPALPRFSSRWGKDSEQAMLNTLYIIIYTCTSHGLMETDRGVSEIFITAMSDDGTHIVLPLNSEEILISNLE